MSLDPMQVVNQVVAPGWDHFAAKFGAAFQRDVGAEALASVRAKEDEEKFREIVALLLDHQAVVTKVIRAGEFSVRDQATNRTSGDYCTDQALRKRLFEVLAPSPVEEVQPVFLDRTVLLERCKKKDAPFFVGRTRGLSERERQVAEVGRVAYSLFGYRESRPPGNGTLDEAHKGFELVLFLHILDYLAMTRGRMEIAAARGELTGPEADDLKSSAKRYFGFTDEAAEVLPEVGLFLVRAEAYEPRPVLNPRYEFVRDGDRVRGLELSWDLPDRCCDGVSLEWMPREGEGWQRIFNNRRCGSHAHDCSAARGGRITFRIRSNWRGFELAVEKAPLLTVLIPDEPRIDAAEWQEGKAVVRWIPARNSERTLLFRRQGGPPIVEGGRATHPDTRLVRAAEAGETTYEDRDAQPGRFYIYLPVAEYPDGVYCSGGQARVQVPAPPAAPRSVRGEYLFDERSGEGQVRVTIVPGPDSAELAYRVTRTEQGTAGPPVPVKKEPADLVCLDPAAATGRVYLYHAAPDRKGIPGTPAHSDPVFAAPGLWGLTCQASDNALDLGYKTHPDVKEVCIRRGRGHVPASLDDGERVIAQKNTARDPGLVTGESYTYLAACRYVRPDGSEAWSAPQTLGPFTPKIQPQPAHMSARLEEGRVVCYPTDFRTGRLHLRRVAERPAYAFGQKIPLARVQDLGKGIPVLRTVGTDRDPDPREPYYVVFTANEEEGHALVGDCCYCPCVPDVTGLRCVVVPGGFRLTWKWPGKCDTAIVLKEKGARPADPVAEKDLRGTVTWKYRGETQTVISHTAYAKDGDSYYLSHPGEGEWYVTVRAVTGAACSAGTAESCMAQVPAVARTILDYAVHRRGGELVFEWRLDRVCSPFSFFVTGDEHRVPATPGEGRRLFTVDRQSWPVLAPGQIERRSIPSPYDGRGGFCRLFIEPGEAARDFVAIRHPADVLSPVAHRRPLGESGAAVSSRYADVPQRRVLCPYCFKPFPWWRMRLREQMGKERRVSWWRQVMGWTSLVKGAPDSLLHSAHFEKVCPGFCAQARAETGQVRPLDNRLFSMPTVHVGLVGTTLAGKSHWIYSVYDRLACLGLSPIDGQTDKRVKAMRAKVEEQRAALERTLRPGPTEIVPPLLFEASWHQGQRRMALALCDVDGDSWGIFGQAGQMRYLQTSHGLVFLVDPLQIPQVRHQLGQALPEDALDDSAIFDQAGPVDNLLTALSAKARPKYKIPVAVVLSKGDIVRHVDPVIRETLWETPQFQTREGSLYYDLALHWNVQFPVRKFLQDHLPKLVSRIEGNFEHFAYFCVAPTGCSARGSEASRRFERFAPWRVEEPLLWIFSQLGVIPTA